MFEWIRIFDLLLLEIKYVFLWFEYVGEHNYSGLLNINAALGRCLWKFARCPIAFLIVAFCKLIYFSLQINIMKRTIEMIKLNGIEFNISRCNLNQLNSDIPKIIFLFSIWDQNCFSMQLFMQEFSGDGFSPNLKTIRLTWKCLI